MTVSDTVRERVGAALTLMQIGESHLTEEVEDFKQARVKLDALALKIGATYTYAHNPKDAEAAFHQCSLALAGAWNGGINREINEIRELLIHGLEWNFPQS
jgi:hypothetical protein